MPMPDDGPFDFGSAMEDLVDSGEVSLTGEEDEKSAPAPAPPYEPEGELDEGGEPAPAPPAPAPAPAPSDYPKSWKPEHKERWATLDPEVRAEVLRRENDFHQGLAPYRQLADRVRESLEPVQQLVQQGQDPFKLFKAFGQYHSALSNPQTAPEAFRALMKDYGVTVEQLSTEAPYIHPQVKSLQDKLDGIESHLSSQEQQRLQAQQATLRSTLEAFAADPQNEHFDAVAGQMATLIRADSKLTLADAYNQALWLVPSVREKLLTKQREEAAAAAAKAARATKGSVRSNARTAPATGAVGSMDDTMRETLAALKGRDG